MKRSKFSLSNYKLLSCDMGYLVPIGLTEVLPGDTIQQSTSLLVRVSPLLAPVMHPVHIKVHHWFVPHRLVWEDWEDFITGGDYNSTPPTFPTIDLGTDAAVEGSLEDYLGVPTNVQNLVISALPLRGYNMIFNEWYRDQDLQTEIPISKASGNDTTTTNVLQRVAWDKDYFTTARPWPQKGDDVVIPFADTAAVERKANADRWLAFDEDTNTPASSGDVTLVGNNLTGLGGTYLSLDPNGGLEADLTDAPGTIRQLREAMALQRYAEARARYGSRYTEYLRYLGINSSDARLQRPEYLGGGKQTIQFSEVLQTAPAEVDSTITNVGELRGHGIGAMRSNRYRRFFEEHGYIFTLMHVKPKTMYVQGLQRHWNRRTKEDFFQKELQHIGQQEILNKEIYAQGTSADDQGFGWQDRYDDYRRGISTVAGDFRSTLNFWHYARIFSVLPTLNEAFIQSVPTKRVNAVQDEDVLWVMANHSIQARRIVSKGAGGKAY